jgi:hypothetical protein
MILKFQKPLASSEPDPPVLVYNENRTFEITLPFDSDTPYRYLFLFVNKFYANCSIIDDEPVIRKIIEDQGW